MGSPGLPGQCRHPGAIQSHGRSRQLFGEQFLEDLGRGTELSSGTLFLFPTFFFGACPTKLVFRKKGHLFFQGIPLWLSFNGNPKRKSNFGV